MSGYTDSGKLIFDLFVSFWLIVLLLPVYFALTFLVILKMGWPVFFVQVRQGKDGRPFKLIKFRSMTNETDGKGNLLPNEKRLTNFGKWLRSASLDELPELLNVLMGNMSLIGPRPLLMEYIPLYNDFQKRRMEVKPGITGWAQVNGRNAITWEEKFKYDVWYVNNLSLWLDIKIVFATLFKVLTGEGINQPGRITMEEFKGTREHTK